MKKSAIIFTLVLGIITVACKHSTVVPETPVMSFTNDINPIVIGNCAQANCHGNTDPEEFTLLTYDDVIQHGKVKPGSPADSKLYQCIRQLTGENLMPKAPYDRLSDLQIQKVYLWILQGAKNN